MNWIRIKKDIAAIGVLVTGLIVAMTIYKVIDVTIDWLFFGV